MNRDVRLRVEGSLLERLIQRALNDGASFARIQRLGPRSIQLDADARSADIVRALCEKYWLDCRVLRRGGFAAMRDKLRARWTLGLGALLCAAICALFLSRLWLVDVRFTGPAPQLGSERAIRDCLEEHGVRVGMPVSAVDAELLQSELLAGAGDYSFVGVRRQGVRLLVEASPEVPAPQVYDLNYARDLVAARDGVVESITVHAGHAAVKPGDTVRRGQLLIRGEEARTREETAPVGASGEVIARSWCEGSAEGALTGAALRRTGRCEAESALQLLGLSLPLSECAGYASEEAELEILPVGGLFLPLEVRRVIHWETAPVRVEADPGALEARLRALALAEARAKLAAGGMDWTLRSTWTDCETEGDVLRVRAVCEIAANIAVTRDALNQEVN